MSRKRKNPRQLCSNHANQFPPEIIYQIFSRMPIKSLARFRCVCKLWYKYINDPHLETIHDVKEEPTPIMFQPYQISFLRLIQGTATAKRDQVMEFGLEHTWFKIRKTRFLGSCNGLTLVCYEANSGGDYLLALIDPLRKKRYDLPPITGCVEQFCSAGIGFDDFTNTFKTVCVIYKEIPKTNVVCTQTMVHDSGMSSWREIPKNPAYPIIDVSVFAHGRLHWLVEDDESKVVWFDVKMEEFGLTDPPKPKLDNWEDNQLVDLNGEVGFAYIGTCLELWILKQDHQWMLHLEFDLTPISHSDEVKVLGYLNKGGDILLASDDGLCLSFYTMQTKDLRDVYVTDGREDEHKADIQMYQSSLFSLRGVHFRVTAQSIN